MSEPADITHDERHRALVEQLAANLRPVRRLWPIRVRLALWLAVGAVVAGWVLTHTHNDFVHKLGDPTYALETLFFAAAAVMVAIIALRAAIPGLESASALVALPFALVALGTLMVIMQPMRTGYPLSEFIRAGRICAYDTWLLAAAPWVVLWWAVRRGAPIHGGSAGFAVGAAAALFSFALMRLGCPNDERLHLLVWHLFPAILVTAISAVAGALWLRLRLGATRAA